MQRELDNTWIRLIVRSERITNTSFHVKVIVTKTNFELLVITEVLKVTGSDSRRVCNHIEHCIIAVLHIMTLFVLSVTTSTLTTCMLIIPRLSTARRS